MKIEAFNVSEDCCSKLQRTGVTVVEEVVEFLEAIGRSRPIVDGADWFSCLDEIVTELKVLGLWSEELEQYWPSS